MRLSRKLSRTSTPQVSCINLIPAFLCPAIARPAHRDLRHERPNLYERKITLPFHRRQTHSAIDSARARPAKNASRDLRALPLSCPGCGALTQTIYPDEAGFYSTDRKSVTSFITQRRREVTAGPAESAKVYIDNPDDHGSTNLDVSGTNAPGPQSGKSISYLSQFSSC